MKDMGNIYRHKSDEELRTLRSKKSVAIDKLRRQGYGYLVKQEIARQLHLIALIDAEIACRRDQLQLL